MLACPASFLKRLSSNLSYIAGCLLAYACKLSFEHGKKGYNGFVSFDSKTKLIPVYEDKYGASHIGGLKMYFSPEAGTNLINKYLKE